MTTRQPNQEQVAFLDHLMTLNFKEDIAIDEHCYCFYEAQIERWMSQGYYHDAMLTFWHGFSIERQYFRHLDSFYSFVQVVNGLGFLMPSPKQFALLNSLAYIDSITAAQTIDEKIGSIYSLWFAIEEGLVHDLAFLLTTFATMREKNLLRETQKPAFNEQKFHRSYEQLLIQLAGWQQRYPQSKMDIYSSLIHRGESFAEQLKRLQAQPIVTMPLKPSNQSDFFQTTMQHLQRWLKISA